MLMTSTVLTTSIVETRHPVSDHAKVYWEVVVTQERDDTAIRFYASAKEVASRSEIGDRWIWHPTLNPDRSAIANHIGLRLQLQEQLASFATDVIIGTKSIGLGTYLLSQLLIHAQRTCPNCRFERSWLSPVDAATPAERSRRNQFYERLGFRIQFKPNSDRREGWVYADKLSDLTPSWSSQRNPIREIPPSEILRDRVHWETEALNSKDAIASLQQFRHTDEQQVHRLIRLLRWSWLAMAVLASVLLYTTADG